ncbi:TPA: hypothetical protein JAN72_06570 [Legionella pneumophila]|uniref:DUF1376 domain-containing protein n=1 Tax=Legionella pneumophila TaxID=446 RepID=A0AAN5R604_LEGPN|nr:hypothetical protein [Legionella pneumophila]HAT1972306.1 hypothetical protein [Legionella pneumophila]HAT6956425.1 hypothetical protein [Legionella pneumophila]HEN4771755.1 hypothetical protein [Legionella pneumophila]
MPRNRMIKCEYWTSEQVLSCSPLARLLFIGFWNFADDSGVHPASLIRLKAEVFPSDNFSISEIKSFVEELISNNLLITYEVDGKSYWLVTGWKKHQRIDKPTYRHPLPLFSKSDPIQGALAEYSTNNLEEVGDETTSPLQEVATKEKEKKVKERNNICEVKTSLVDSSQTRTSTSVQEIFQHWQITMSKPKAKLDRKRQNIIKAALRLGYTSTELKQAIDGCAKTPHNMGKNDRNQIYNDISLILRDADHIERFINNANEYNTCSGLQSTDDLMAGVI